MIDQKDFNIGNKTIWLNCAHQGPMPQCAKEALIAACKFKDDPSTIPDSAFFDVPLQLKNALAKLFDASPEEIILGDSATYTINLLINGIPWKKGDEILLIDGDFPTDIIPWQPLKQIGVKIKMIKAVDSNLTLDELKLYATEKTKLLCVSWTNSFNGHSINIHTIGRFCRSNRIIFALNGSQSFGYIPISFSKSLVDVAFGCGFKWLLGPYGTGFGWMTKTVRELLKINRYYWLNQYNEDLSKLNVYKIREKENYLDIFNTANFFNYIPWTASLQYLNEMGMEKIAVHNKELVTSMKNGLNTDKYSIISPLKTQDMSSIFTITSSDKIMLDKLHQRLKSNNIFSSLRDGNIRFSPHLYNSREQIENVLSYLR
jgi:cysteine desulfurase/selenocysteine lyase